MLIGHDHYGRTGHAVLGNLPRVLALAARARFERHLPRPSFDMETRPHLEELQRLLETKRLSPSVDRSFPFDQFQEAMRYLESPERCGNVVLRL